MGPVGSPWGDGSVRFEVSARRPGDSGTGCGGPRASLPLHSPELDDRGRSQESTLPTPPRPRNPRVLSTCPSLEGCG